jgi:hypothetical protein
MAAQAHPYLALFHTPREIQLYYGRTRRTASPAGNPWGSADQLTPRSSLASG